MADRQSRTAVDQRDGIMRILWLMFVAAIGVVLIGAVYLLSIPSNRAVRKMTTRRKPLIPPGVGQPSISRCGSDGRKPVAATNRLTNK